MSRATYLLIAAKAGFSALDALTILTPGTVYGALELTRPKKD